MLDFYHKLLEHSPEERVALTYYHRHQKYLTLMQVQDAIRNNSDESKPLDFSFLDKSMSTAFIETYQKHVAAQADDIYLTHEDADLQPHENIKVSRDLRCVTEILHMHDYYEIFYVLHGSTIQGYVEGQPMRLVSGDVLIIPPFTRHYGVLGPDDFSLYLSVRKSSFESVFGSILQYDNNLANFFNSTLYAHNYSNYLLAHCAQDKKLFDQFLLMYEYQISGKPYTHTLLEGQGLAFFAYLMQNYDAVLEVSSGENNLNDRITKIRSFISQHYQTVTLDAVSEHFGLSAPYISALLKKQTGQPFSEIVSELKIQHAKDFLTSTNMRVDDVCLAVGYNDTTHFIRKFKNAVGMTPNQFRKQAKKAGANKGQGNK